MKKMFFAIGVVLFMWSCKNPADNKAGETTNVKKTVELPLSVGYKGEAAIGKQENIVAVMNWNKHMIAGHVDSAAAFIADSMLVNLADGSTFNLSHDSAIAMLKGWRGSMDSAKQSYGAVIAVDNTTAGDEWVIQWTDESYFRKGKEEHVMLSESYRLKNGKIRQVNQYSRAVATKK